VTAVDRIPAWNPWLVRLMLGAILMTGSEVLLWTNVSGRPWWDWLVTAAAYWLIAALLLDVMARWRVRDFAGVVTVAGLYGLLNGLLINPAVTLFAVPESLVTYVTGAHSLIGLEMLYLFLALTGGHLRHLRGVMAGGALLVGAAWGFWVRWAPQPAPVTLETMLLAGLIGVALTAALTGWVYRRAGAIYPRDVILPPLQYALIGLTLGALLVLRLAQGSLDPTAVTLVAILLFLCGAILWFRRQTMLPTILDYHLPVFPMRWRWTLPVTALFFWAGVLSYSLPVIGSESFNAGTAISLGFMLYGLSWLPVISVLLGFRAYVRQAQAQPFSD
jgi:hypothetical protein